MATGDASGVSNFLLGVQMGVLRLRSTSLLVMFRMHFITWVFPNGFDLIFA